MQVTEVNFKGNQFVVKFYKTFESALESGVSISEDNLRDYAQESGHLSFCNDSADCAGNHVQDAGSVDFEDFIQDSTDLEKLIADYVTEKIYKS